MRKPRLPSRIRLEGNARLKKLAAEGGVNVVIAADRNYLYPALAVLCNLAEKGVWEDTESKVWFIAPSKSLREADVRALSQLIEALGVKDCFEFLEVDVESLPETHGYLSKTSLVRLLVPKIMGLGKWMWVDVDAILCCSWQEVRDAFFPSDRKSTIVAARCHVVDPVRQQMSGNPERSYFNAGLMSWSPIADHIDGNLMLKKYLEALRFFLSKGTMGDDQDALNLVHKNDVEIISGDFNAYGDFLLNPVNFARIRIAHFAGATKPWHLPDRVKYACLESGGCPWSQFFRAEAELARVAAASGTSLPIYLRKLGKQSRSSGKPDWKIVWFSKLIVIFPRFMWRLKILEPIRKGNHAHPLHF